MLRKITAAIREALTGSRRILVTFKPEIATETARLLDLDRTGAISMFQVDRVNLCAVAGSKWGACDTRIVPITLAETFNEELFVNQMGDVLEDIRVVD